MASNQSDWEADQIKQRLARAAQDARAPVSQFISLKVRPLRRERSALKQTYLDGHQYLEIRRRLDHRLDNRWEAPNRAIQFEEHESGPELILDLAHLTLEVVGTIIAVIGCVLAVISHKKSASSQPSRLIDQVSISLRTAEKKGIKELEITVISSSDDAAKAATQAKEIIAALDKATKRRKAKSQRATK